MATLNEIKLAEFLGTMMGDGNLSLYKSDYRISITGHKNDDLDYFKYLQKLFFELFNKEAKIRDKKRYILLEISNKDIFHKIHNAGVPIGKKSDIVKIPDNIIKDENSSRAFLRGFADAEFSVTFKKAGRKSHSYPRISVDISSKEMINQISGILNNLNISHKIYKRERKRKNTNYKTYMIDINGRENLQKWLENIGFNNKKHLSKIEIWKKQGFYNPHNY